MKTRLCAYWIAVFLLGFLQPSAASGQQPDLAPLQALLAGTCLDCHSADEPSGQLDLTPLQADLQRALQTDHAVDWSPVAWEKIVKRLRARQMPPASYARPTEKEMVAALAGLESALDHRAQGTPQPGRTESIRRLNRTEYRLAVRDLLGVEVDVNRLLPADSAGHGFDNVTVGDLPPILLSRYLSAAEQVSRLAVGDSDQSPIGYTLRLPADRTQDRHIAGLPLGTRGGTVFRYHFPADGSYEIQCRLMRDRDENVEGLNRDTHLDLLLDRARQHRFVIEAPKRTGKNWQRDDTLADAHLKKRLDVSAGVHEVGVTFPAESYSLSEIRREPFVPSFNRHRHPRQAPAIFEVSIVGPLESTRSQSRPAEQQHPLLTCWPEEDADGVVDIGAAEKCAQTILAPVIRRAYRREITSEDWQVPMKFFRSRAAADGFAAGMEMALTAVLVNPHFLLRVETAPDGLQAGDAYRISDTELASRLSFFLWSSLPDDELLDLASQGRLHEPTVLGAQVERMLTDERAQALVTNFAAQWLYLRNLKSFRPDMRRFPNFDDNLRQAMRRETELLFARIMEQDRSILELIRSDTTFLNERLATHYGISGVLGSHFRPVRVEQDSHRGGILRHASILAVTSYATRTSPTIRGNWILENILGTPPPPPPPNVPSLQEKTRSSALSVRERLAVHRENPACASCHDLMDPVGFALENFDAVGRWRSFDDGATIDSSGALPDGRVIDSVEDLERGIMDRPELFAATVTEKLLTYALGRGIEATDGPAVRQVVRHAAAHDYRFSSLIQGIVLSPPFQMRTAQ